MRAAGKRTGTGMGPTDRGRGVAGAGCTYMATRGCSALRGLADGHTDCARGCDRHTVSNVARAPPSHFSLPYVFSAWVLGFILRQESESQEDRERE